MLMLSFNDTFELWREHVHHLFHESMAVAIGVFNVQGNLLYANVGMHALLETSDATHTPSASLMNPDFQTLISHPAATGLIFDGLLTTGNHADIYRTVRAKVYRKQAMLLLIGEYDVRDLESWTRQMAALNQEISNTQRALMKEKCRLEQTLAELRDTQAMLIHAEKMSALGQLVAGVAHELNNPLAFVTSNLYTLKQSFDDLAQAYTRLETLIEQTGNHDMIAAAQAIRADRDLDFLIGDLPDLYAASSNGLARVQKIVQDLRTFSRLDESAVKEIDLAASVGSAIALVEPELKKRRISAILHLDNFPPIVCSATEVNQVFLNLIVNAIQAMEPGGTLTITGAMDTDSVRLDFADTGVGIPPENFDKIFQPFFTTKPVGSGTGLGLSLAYKIVVEQHHGSLTVASTVNVGTVFTMILPRFLKPQQSAT